MQYTSQMLSAFHSSKFFLSLVTLCMSEVPPSGGEDKLHSVDCHFHSDEAIYYITAIILCACLLCQVRVLYAQWKSEQEANSDPT